MAELGSDPERERRAGYAEIVKAGLIAIRLNEDDELVSVVPTNGEDDVLMVARDEAQLEAAAAEFKLADLDKDGIIVAERNKDGKGKHAQELAIEYAAVMPLKSLMTFLIRAWVIIS